LPNKLYEFIHAKIAIAISPSLEMKTVVEKYNLGVVSKEFKVESLVAELSKIKKTDISQFKKNAEKASSIENAEYYQDIFLNQILSLSK
jgi:hypothetical protein